METENPVKVNYAVIKEKIIKTDEILKMYFEKNHKLKKCTQTNEELKCQHDRLLLDNERNLNNLKCVKSEKEELELKYHEISNQLLELEKKYNQQVVESQSCIKSLEDELTLQKELKQMCVSPIKNKENRKSKGDKKIIEELEIKCRDIETYHKKENNKLSRDIEVLEEKLSKLEDEKKSDFKELATVKMNFQQLQTQMENKIKTHILTCEQKNKEIQELKLALSVTNDMKQRFSFLESENQRLITENQRLLTENSIISKNLNETKSYQKTENTEIQELKLALSDTNELEHRVSFLESENQRLITENQRLLTENSIISKNLNESKSYQKTENTEIQELKLALSDTNELEHRVNFLESENQRLVTENQRILTENSIISKNLNESKSYQKTENTEIQELKLALSVTNELKQRVSFLESENQRLINENCIKSTNLQEKKSENTEEPKTAKKIHIISNIKICRESDMDCNNIFTEMINIPRALSPLRSPVRTVFDVLSDDLQSEVHDKKAENKSEDPKDPLVSRRIERDKSYKKLIERRRALRNNKILKKKHNQQDSVLKALQILKKSKLNFTITNERSYLEPNTLKCSNCRDKDCTTIGNINSPLVWLKNQLKHEVYSDNVLNKLADLVTDNLKRIVQENEFSSESDHLSSKRNEDILTINTLFIKKFREELLTDEKSDMCSEISSDISLPSYLNNLSQLSSPTDPHSHCDSVPISRNESQNSFISNKKIGMKTELSNNLMCNELNYVSTKTKLNNFNISLEDNKFTTSNDRNPNESVKKVNKEKPEEEFEIKNPISVDIVQSNSLPSSSDIIVENCDDNSISSQISFEKADNLVDFTLNSKEEFENKHLETTYIFQSKTLPSIPEKSVEINLSSQNLLVKKDEFIDDNYSLEFKEPLKALSGNDIVDYLFKLENKRFEEPLCPASPDRNDYEIITGSPKIIPLEKVENGHDYCDNSDPIKDSFDKQNDSFKIETNEIGEKKKDILKPMRLRNRVINLADKSKITTNSPEQLGINLRPRGKTYRKCTSSCCVNNEKPLHQETALSSRLNSKNTKKRTRQSSESGSITDICSEIQIGTTKRTLRKSRKCSKLDETSSTTKTEQDSAQYENSNEIKNEENDILLSQVKPKKPVRQKPVKKLTKLQSSVMKQMKVKQKMSMKPKDLDDTISHCDLEINEKPNTVIEQENLSIAINEKIKIDSFEKSVTDEFDVRIRGENNDILSENSPLAGCNILTTNGKISIVNKNGSDKQKKILKSQKKKSNALKLRNTEPKNNCDILSQIMGEMDKVKVENDVKTTVVIKKDSPSGIAEKEWRKRLLDIAEVTHQSNISDMTSVYGPIPYKKHRSGILKVGAGIPKKITFLMKHLLKIPNEEDIPKDIIVEFKRLQIDFIVELIIYYVTKDSDTPDNKYYPAPLMTRTQRIFLSLLLVLEKDAAFQDIVTKFFFKTQEFIFKMGCGIRAAIPLTRLFLSLCRLYGNINRMRAFCCEAFFELNQLAIPIFFTVLTSWTEVMPSADKVINYPMAKVLFQLVHLKSFKLQGYNLMPLKGLLSQYYGFPKERYNCDELFDELCQEYLRQPSMTSDYALRLFCKNKDSSWVYKKLNAFFKPLIYKIPSENVNFKSATIILMGKICRMFKPKIKKDLDCLRELERWFTGLLQDETAELIRGSVQLSLEYLPKIGKQHTKARFYEMKANLVKTETTSDL